MGKWSTDIETVGGLADGYYNASTSNLKALSRHSCVLPGADIVITGTLPASSSARQYRDPRLNQAIFK